jgi:spermidine synthase
MCKVIDLFERFERVIGGTRESPPYIVEARGMVRLHFKALDVQSEMRTNAPDELVLRYTRTMVGALAFKKSLRHIGMIGLGGGSIPKYCYRHFPRTKISVAEISPEVIALRDRFFIPKDDRRFAVYCEDGAEFVRRQPGRFDALLVDGFDGMGQSPQLSTAKFYSDCRRSLTPQGLLIVNICDSHELIPNISRSFLNQVILADGDEKCSNTIVIAGKGNILTPPDGPLKTKRVAYQFHTRSEISA